MKLFITSVTAQGTNCVSSLIHELSPLEKQAQSWDFPYDIMICIRCGKNVGKTFQRFENKDQVLTLDIREEDELFRVMSKNEQREYLGRRIFSYMEESIKKYPKAATTHQQEAFMKNVKQWMMAHDWLHGKIEQVRTLLQNEMGAYEISEQMHMPLEEVEDIWIHMYEEGKRTTTHSDNIKEGKNWVWKI